MASLSIKSEPLRPHSVPHKSQAKHWKISSWTCVQPQSGPTCLLHGRSSTIGPSSVPVSLQPPSTKDKSITTCCQRSRCRKPTLTKPMAPDSFKSYALAKKCCSGPQLKINTLLGPLSTRLPCHTVSSWRPKVNDSAGPGRI